MNGADEQFRPYTFLGKTMSMETSEEVNFVIPLARFMFVLLVMISDFIF